MARRKVSHTGRLSDPIKGSDAHARGLGKQLGAAASEADTYRFIQREREAKWLQLDNKLGLDSSCADIWEKRAKALFHERFALPADSHDWWKIVATALAISSYAGLRSVTSSLCRFAEAIIVKFIRPVTSYPGGKAEK